MFKIKSIECSAFNNTKTYILNVENNTTSYLVNPSDFDNHNQLRLLTNFELEDYVTSNKFSINEDIIIHRDQNSKVSTPIVDYSNNFGYFVYEYDYKNKKITTYIDMLTLNTRYERDIVKNLILVGNDNNNWLIQKGNKNKTLSSRLHNKQIEVIKQNLDIHYTTYDKTML